METAMESDESRQSSVKKPPAKKPRVAPRRREKDAPPAHFSGFGWSPQSIQQLSSPAGVEWVDDMCVLGDSHKDHNIAAGGATLLLSVRCFKELCEKEDSRVYRPHCSSDELSQQMGVTSDELEEIKKACNPQSLLVPPPNIDKASPLHYVRSPRRSVHHLDKLEHASISFTNILHSGSKRETNTPVDPKEVILCIDVFHPIKTVREQHFLVVASQKLTELCDLIMCPNDYYCTDDLSESPAALSEDPTHEPTNTSKSSFFFIGTCFYDDMRHPEAIKTSRKIISWSEEGERIAKSSRLDHFEARLMEDTTFEMLKFRLGWPYLYCHHGNCNHLVIFRDMRLFNARIDPVFVEDYPRLTFYNKAVFKKQMCQVCDKDASWVTTEDELSRGGDSHSFFCQNCFVKLHYTLEGRKVNDSFKAYRYRVPDPPTLIV